MRPVCTVAEMRAREAVVVAQVGEGTLIQRAAAAVARRAIGMLGGAYGRRVVVLAGKGHNGADALWAGVLLARRGARIEVALALGEPADDHGREPLRGLPRRTGQLGGADLVIDGMVGIGSTGELRARPAELAAAAQAAGVPVLAVDVPSGLDADTGEAVVAVRADVTVTFGALKPGLLLGRGAELAGMVEVAEIGLAPEGETAWGVLDADDVAALLPSPEPGATKYTRGVVGLVAGSPQYVGAAVLAAGGAVRAGAGMVRLHAPGDVATAVRARWPEVVHATGEPVDDRKVDAWVVGPGLDPDSAALAALLADPRPVLLDAGALQDAGQIKGHRGPAVLTPHAGEYERLVGPVPVTRAAADLDAVVLLKGFRTVVAAPDGRTRINPTGTPYLATAGTGDVLSGAIGAYLAAGLRPLEAAAAGAWLHGLAGRIAAGEPPAPIVASDVAACWPDAVRRVASQP